MRVLFISNLFPNQFEPRRGVFNLPRVKHWLPHMEVCVVAPLSWFFIRGRYAHPTGVPLEETIEGIKVYHPRAFYIPKVFRIINPALFAVSLYPILKRLQREFAFRQIHVDWLYPDACGVALVARRLGVPFTVSVAGTDANVYMKWRVRRLQICHALARSSAVITRSLALQRVLEQNGVPSQKIQTVYNGVDCDKYLAIPRELARKQLGLTNDATVLLYVGNMVPVKGVPDLLEAFRQLRAKSGMRITLVMVGDGYLRDTYEKQARGMGFTGDDIHWTGNVPPPMVPLYMSAANLLCLASHSEGVPNVLLEANACGLPFVATAVGGVSEITTTDTGVLTPARDPAAFAQMIIAALDRHWDSARLREHALQFSWRSNAERMVEIFRTVQSTTCERRSCT